MIAMNTYLIKIGSPEEIVGVKDPSAFGEEVYPTLFEKAMILYINLVKRPCFHNGNKRTSHMSLIAFLRMIGYEWTMPFSDAIEMPVDVAKSDGDFEILKQKILSLIEDNTVKRD